MPENKDALLDHFRGMHATLMQAIAGLSDEQMSETSLDGWSVKDHLAHLALWDDIRAAEVARISAGFDSAWRMSGDQDGVFNEIAHDIRVGLSVAQAKWELESAHQKLLEALAGATERGLDASLYGEAGLTSGHAGEHAGWIMRWRGEKGI
jgi:hypothetical protein